MLYLLYYTDTSLPFGFIYPLRHRTPSRPQWRASGTDTSGYFSDLETCDLGVFLHINEAR